MFPPFKSGGGGGAKSLGGTQNVWDPHFSHFVAPPSLPVINDQSLKSGGKVGWGGVGTQHSLVTGHWSQVVVGCNAQSAQSRVTPCMDTSKATYA